MTQGNPLSPKIFNIVVDAVMCHWVAVVSEEEAGPEGLCQLIQCLEMYVYDKKILIA